ncbi:MAG: AraC family transcriptional regulator [Bacteroidales bacterium]|nr:AraC family transcriptional regulator [Bacteroidales bacterium]
MKYFIAIGILDCISAALSVTLIVFYLLLFRLLVIHYPNVDKRLVWTMAVILLVLSAVLTCTGNLLWLALIYAFLGCAVSCFLLLRRDDAQVVYEDPRLLCESPDEEFVEPCERLDECREALPLHESLYSRLITYMEGSKPYLNPNLKMDDVARVLYSNRVYLSQTIKYCAGKNYCQLINFYRVTHAVECLKNDPHLRVNQLADMSGFRSVAAFNVAFRSVMGRSPGDWARAYREGEL